MTSGNIDYAALYFKYKNPNGINGEPTYKSLKRLKTELRANASSVDTDLGGGDHGYLGLVLSDAEYARISPTPAAFVAPNFPGALVIDPAFTAMQAVQARESHNEVVALYREGKMWRRHYCVISKRLWKINTSNFWWTTTPDRCAYSITIPI